MPTQNELIQPETTTNITVVEVCDFKLIKSSEGRDKLSHEGFIYNIQRQTNDKKKWLCQVKNCKDYIQWNPLYLARLVNTYIHGPEIGKVFEFRAGVKRSAREIHDNLLES